ncbi:MAG: alpha/beta hydrolase [Desulfovermiculus sp.]|nr:alpha/beta hydrolase [Desulfovermiculus sp.]
MRTGEESLHPRLEEWLQTYNAYLRQLAENGFQLTPSSAREGLASLTRQWTLEKIELPWIEDDLILPPSGPPVPVRIYHPDPDTPLSVLIYYHGGGHMAGSVSEYDPICRKLAHHIQHVLISVDYRLAPENPYPAGVEDALNSARYVWATLDSREVAYKPSLRLSGDSAGGALSATVAHQAQYDAGLPVEAQVLIYPSLDYTMSSASIDEYNSGFLLQRQNIQWYFDNYFQHGEDRKKASPLFMEVTPNFPDTLVITAGFCPLQDEGRLYVQNLQKQGIRAEHVHFPDMIHAFLNMERLFPERIQELYKVVRSFLSLTER